MQNVGIATDSTTDLKPEAIDELGVEVTPIVAVLDGEDVELRPEMDVQAYFERFAQAEDAKTSGVNVDAWYQAYGRLLQRSKSVITLCLAETLSVSYQAAKTAASLREGSDITVIDPHTVCSGLTALVVQAARLAQQGAVKDEVLRYVESAAPDTHCYLITPSVTMLQRIGRLLEPETDSPDQPGLADQPRYAVLRVTEEGGIRPVGAAPDADQAIHQVVSMAQQDARDGAPLQLAFSHGRNAPLAKRLREAAEQALPLGAPTWWTDDGPITAIVADGVGGVSFGLAPTAEVDQGAVE